MTPLEETIMRDDVPALKLLIDSGADTNKADPQGLPPLALAIEEQKYETAKALIEAGANVNSVASKDQLTPLMIAAAESQPAEGSMFLPTSTRPIDIAKALIKRGADVNAKDKDGMTALMVATSHDNAPTIGLLLQSGANAEAKNNRGEQALDIAKLNGNQEAAQAISVLGKALSGTKAPSPGKAQGVKS
jgi:ankyrin repeat protein